MPLNIGNDLEKKFYETQLGATDGSLSDLENRWLQSKVSHTGVTGDLWNEYLRGLGYSGSLNDMISVWSDTIDGWSNTIYGSELIINSGFYTNLSGWDVSGSTPPGMMVWDVDRAEVSTGGGGVARMVQAVPVVNGHTYRFNYTGTMTTRIGTTSGGIEVKPLDTQGRSDVGVFTFVAPTSTVYISVVDSTNGRYIDNISLREVLGAIVILADSSAITADASNVTADGKKI